MILFSLFLGSYPNFLSQNSSGFVFNFLRETCLLLASNPSTLLGFNFPMLLNRIGTVCLNSAISVSLSDFYCTYIYCCFLLLCLFILASKSNLSYSLFEFTLIFWFSWLSCPKDVNAYIDFDFKRSILPFFALFIVKFWSASVFYNFGLTCRILICLFFEFYTFNTSIGFSLLPFLIKVLSTFFLKFPLHSEF